MKKRKNTKDKLKIRDIERLRKKIEYIKKNADKLDIKMDRLMIKRNIFYCDECGKYYSGDECKNKIEYWDPDPFCAPECATRCPKKHIIDEPKSAIEWPR